MVKNNFKYSHITNMDDELGGGATSSRKSPKVGGNTKNKPVKYDDKGYPIDNKSTAIRTIQSKKNPDPNIDNEGGYLNTHQTMHPYRPIENNIGTAISGKKRKKIKQ